MKKIILLSLLISSTFSTTAQFVATMEIKEPIEGLCDKKTVYALFPTFSGQKEAKSPLSKDEILKLLNNKVSFLKNNPDYEDKGMIGLVINCKGEVVQCKMDNKTKSVELDRQIEDIFNSLGKWKAGKLNGKAVDTSRLFSFEIKNGEFKF